VTHHTSCLYVYCLVPALYILRCVCPYIPILHGCFHLSPCVKRPLAYLEYGCLVYCMFGVEDWTALTCKCSSQAKKPLGALQAERLRRIAPGSACSAQSILLHCAIFKAQDAAFTATLVCRSARPESLRRVLDA